MSRTLSDSLDTDLDEVFFNTNEFARSFTLTRGVISTTGVAAIVAVRTYDIDDQNGSTIAVESLDFDLPRSAYQINDEIVDPRAGDVFTDDEEKEYEVLPLPRSQCFVASPDGAVLHVHVKRVK